MRDDAALFAALSGYWEDQRAQVANPDYYLVATGDLATKLYAFPRATGDTVVSVLNNVDCVGGGEIRLAMSLFTDARVALGSAKSHLAGLEVGHHDREPAHEILRLVGRADAGEDGPGAIADVQRQPQQLRHQAVR